MVIEQVFDFYAQQPNKFDSIPKSRLKGGLTKIAQRKNVKKKRIEKVFAFLQ